MAYVKAKDRINLDGRIMTMGEALDADLLKLREVESYPGRNGPVRAYFADTLDDKGGWRISESLYCSRTGKPVAQKAKEYSMPFGRTIGYQHEFPDRTAQTSGNSLASDVTFRVWPTRLDMARAIRREEQNAPRSKWRPLVPLMDCEGY